MVFWDYFLKVTEDPSPLSFVCVCVCSRSVFNCSVVYSIRVDVKTSVRTRVL